MKVEEITGAKVTLEGAVSKDFLSAFDDEESGVSFSEWLKTDEIKARLSIVSQWDDTNTKVAIGTSVQDVDLFSAQVLASANGDSATTQISCPDFFTDTIQRVVTKEELEADTEDSSDDSLDMDDIITLMSTMNKSLDTVFNDNTVAAWGEGSEQNVTKIIKDECGYHNSAEIEISNAYEIQVFLDKATIDSLTEGMDTEVNEEFITSDITGCGLIFTICNNEIVCVQGQIRTANETVDLTYNFVHDNKNVIINYCMTNGTDVICMAVDGKIEGKQINGTFNMYDSTGTASDDIPTIGFAYNTSDKSIALSIPMSAEDIAEMTMPYESMAVTLKYTPDKSKGKLDIGVSGNGTALFSVSGEMEFLTGNVGDMTLASSYIAIDEDTDPSVYLKDTALTALIDKVNSIVDKTFTEEVAEMLKSYVEMYASYM